MTSALALALFLHNQPPQLTAPLESSAPLAQAASAARAAQASEPEPASGIAPPRQTGAPATPPTAQSGEVVSDILVHGNQIVPDADVKALAGIVVGARFDDAMIPEIVKRLKASGKFESVEVVKRFASIEDASRIVVVIVVSEGSVRIVTPRNASSPAQAQTRSFIRQLMFIPILEGSDGYGLTFGARIAYPKPFGAGTRLSVPLTLGGVRRTGLELEKTFSSGPISRIEVGTGVQDRRNPAYDVDDTRYRVWARAVRAMGHVRAGGTASWQSVTFGGQRETFSSIGADVTVDTRENPALPRNGVLATASVDRLALGTGPSITRTRVEATGFIATVGQQAVVIHLVREGASAPLPPYLRSILGGWWTLRGFRTGFRTGDTLVSGSIEYRLPLVSTKPIGRLGVSAFADWGTAYDRGESLSRQTFDRGVGGTVWFTVASIRLSMAVAHGLGGGTRVHFSGTFGF